MLRLFLAALITVPAAANAADRPEPGKQGETLPGEARVLEQPYSKGVTVIGHQPIDHRTGNVIMAWAGDCAYVGHGITLGPVGIAMVPHGPTSGVAVIDAKNPAAPRLVRYLQDKGALDAAETLHAVTTRSRSVLAASTYGGVAGVNGPKEGWLGIYDVRECANPRLMAEVKWPEPVHTITVSPDGKRVYGTIINPFTASGGIAVMDISNMAAPRFVGRFAATFADGKDYAFAPHEVSVSPDGRRIYAGVLASKAGDIGVGIKPFPPSVVSLGPEAGAIYILDSSDFVRGRKDPKLRLIGTAHHGGWHSVMQARIKGRPYLVGAGELGACPGAWPRLTDISDEKNPRRAGEFRLAMNRPENCPPRDAVEAGSNGVVGRIGVAASHFNDVDSASNTRLGLFSFMYAGLRIADLSDPMAPKEIAYFKPGDACMSHVRYRPKSGEIWFACMDSGFWVIKLDKTAKAGGSISPATPVAASR